VLNPIALGGLTSAGLSLGLGALTGFEGTVGALTTVLPLAVLVVRLDVTLRHGNLPLRSTSAHDNGSLPATHVNPQRTMQRMSGNTIVRLFVATQTDDGHPLLFGVSGADDTWSAEEFEAVRSDLLTVLNFGANEPFGVVQSALTGFSRRHDEIVAAARAGERPEESSFRELQVFLYSFLTAMRSFLDQTDRRLKREFGANSVQREALKTSTSNEFDRSPAYRFLYHLRNHVQHHSVPLGPALGRSTLVTTEAGEEYVEHQLRVSCSREQLLEDGRFKPIVAEWLSEQDTQFEISPLLLSCMDSLRNIRIDYDRQRAPLAVAAAKRLEPPWVLFEGHSGQPGYARFLNTGESAEPIDFTEIPIDRYQLMLASARLTLDAESRGSSEALLIDAPEYHPTSISFGPDNP